VCVSASVRQADATATIERLADAVRGLSVSHRDPERFHMDKSAIVGELRELARRLRARR
jgi:hypothetical protein